MKNLLLSVAGVLVGAYLQKNGYFDKTIEKCKEFGEKISTKVKKVEDKLKDAMDEAKEGIEETTSEADNSEKEN